MYILTITLTKAKASAITTILLIFVLGLIYITPLFTNSKTVSQTDKFLIKNTEKGRQNFINSLGYTVEEKPYLAENFTIPKEFDKLYLDYDEIQKSQGLSLENYKGFKVEKYTYRVTNYKKSNLIVYINIFIYKDHVIAGDINSPDIKNGFVSNFLSQ